MKYKRKYLIDMLILLSRYQYKDCIVANIIQNYDINFSEKDLMYLEYCFKAHDPKTRDYSLLKKFLKRNISDNKDYLFDTLDNFVSALNLPDINYIYDLGAGHVAWAHILNKRFKPNGIVLVDKTSITSSMFKIIFADVFDWLDNVGPLSSNTLIFMSEFLHCKINNMKILQHKNLKGCHILINEVDQTEKLVKDRLIQTGGNLIDPYHLITHMNYPRIYRYTNFFDYYLCYGVGKGK